MHIFVVAQALCDFRASIILVYMILNGKGDLTDCGLHKYSLVAVHFLTGLSNITGCISAFVSRTFFVVSIHQVCSGREKLTTSSVSRLVEGLLDIYTFSNLFILLLAIHYTSQYTLCIVAIVDYLYIPFVQKYQHMPYLVAIVD